MKKEYTPIQRQQIAEALRAAKPFLWKGFGLCGGQTSYICHAVKRGACHRGTPAVRYAVDEIEYRLTGSDNVQHTARSWLYECAGIPDHLLSNQSVQGYRHRWLDALIEEFTD